VGDGKKVIDRFQRNEKPEWHFGTRDSFVRNTKGSREEKQGGKKRGGGKGFGHTSLRLGGKRNL